MKEIGIWLEPDRLDIDRILQSLNYWKVSKNDLYELDNAHREYHIHNRLSSNDSQILIFPKWYDSAHRTLWRVCWWDEANIQLAKVAKSILYEKYGVSDAETYLNSSSQDDYPKNNWILCFTRYQKKLVKFSWMYVDQVVRIQKSDHQAYEAGFPYQFIQVWPMKRYPLPPFKIDNRFRAAFQRAAKKVTWEKLETWARPTASFIRLIYDNYG